MVRNRILAALVAAASILTLGAGTTLAAAEAVDQAQTGVSAINVLVDQDGTRESQTFTAGVSGTLTAVEVNLADVGVIPAVAAPNAADTVTLSVHATDTNGVPNGPALASVTAAVGTGWTKFVFGSPTSLSAGTKYAIQIVGDPGVAFAWAGTCDTAAYTAGQAFIFFDSAYIAPVDYGNHLDATVCLVDFAFRTYMIADATPPPTAALGSEPARGGSSLPLPLLAAGAFAAIALVAFRRFVLVER